MSLLINKLLAKVQAIQKFVDDRNSHDQSYMIIDQALKELDQSLKAGKLILQIVADDLVLVQSLQKLIESNSELRNIYQLRISTLPEIPDPNTATSPPALVFQTSDKNQPTARYELKNTQIQIIGRNPAIAHLLLPDHLHLTSGSHAELRFLEGGWQIRDSDSRNGTFINGKTQKLQDWYTLKSGDQIHLGSACQTAGSATLIFEIPSKDDIHPVYLKTQKLLECNILCLVVPPKPLSNIVQRFIELAKDAYITKFLIVVERPGDINADAFNETLIEIESLIKSQLQSTSFELTSLLLKPFAPSSGATVLAPHSQPEFEQFCEAIKELSDEDTVAILSEWTTNRLNQIIHQIEAILVQKDIALKEKLYANEERFKELSQGNLKKQIEKVYKKVDGERDSFFRQVKIELSQSKANLLDEFRQSSVSYKIQKFAKHLQSNVSDQGGFRYVRLKVRAKDVNDVHDVHAVATELCNTELTQWAAAEWSRIRNEYSGGGLDSLLKKSYESLNFIPEIILPKDDFSIAQTNLSIQSILNVSNVEPTLESRYKKVGFWEYMSKTLRTNMMTILGMVTMFGGGLIAVIGGGLIAVNKASLIFSLLPIVGAVAYLNYRQEKEAKIEEVSEKLQKEAMSYYQVYTKGLADRLIQRIGGLLESEERRFRETLDNVKEIYASHLSELDKTQSQLKSQLDEIKRSGQNKIEKDLVDLRKLKSLL